MLKLVYIVIDGAADRPIEKLGGISPLECANKPSLDKLAQGGLNGLMYTVEKGVAPESDVAVLSILGYEPRKYHTGRGPLEAVGAGLRMEDGDLALRCNFANIGEGWELVDRRVGRSLSSEEAAELSEAINREVSLKSHPADFVFKTTVGHRAVLIIKGRGIKLSAEVSNTDPAYFKLEGLSVASLRQEKKVELCEALKNTPEAKASADLINEFTIKVRELLEEHPINLRRVREGKLKANAVLVRDAGDRVPKLYSLKEAYGLKFVCLADMPVEVGIARLAGMDVIQLPPPKGSLEENYRLRAEVLLKAMLSFDAFYIHIKGPDEAGHDGDARRKAEIISKIDSAFIKPILEGLDLNEAVVCVTSDHATPCELKAHSDDPVPVTIASGVLKPDGVKGFSERGCALGKLGLLKRGVELMPILVKASKGEL